MGSSYELPITYKIHNTFSLLDCLPIILRRPTPGMGNIGDDVVGLFEHPVVAPGDGIMWVDRLDPLREHRVGVVVVLGLLAGHIGQHNCVVDLRIFLL